MIFLNLAPELWGLHMTRTLISSLVLIAIFLVERILSHYIQQRQLKQQWFIDIVVKPHTNLIKSFYEENFDFIESSINQLKELSNTSTTEITEISQNKVDVFKKRKREFELSFFTLVRSSYPDIEERLLNCLLSLDDLIIEPLSKNDYSSIDLNKIKEKVHENKSHFFEILLTNKPKSWYKRFDIIGIIILVIVSVIIAYLSILGIPNSFIPELPK